MTRPTFILGLPYLARGPLLETARALEAPVLLSANAFSEWTIRDGIRTWIRFKTNRLSLLTGLPAYLDSAGFTALKRYGGYPWPLNDYIALCAAFPWRAFFAADLCVEPEIAADATTVLDRISETVANFAHCARAAEQRGIRDRLVPVVQGWRPADYLRCLDRLPIDVDATPLIGVGSVCRRSLSGPNGILAIVDALDDGLAGSSTQLHLFGAKGDAIAALRGHPRVASYDSQAYGVTARRLSLAGGFSKTNGFLAEIMAEWYGRQLDLLNAPSTHRTPVQRAIPFASVDAAPRALEARINRARDEIRDLVEHGEIDRHWLHDEFVLRWALESDDDETDITLAA